jgi:LAO/AO transport system kinase
VFFRSMSARGSLGGLSTATTDAVTALDAFGKDYVIVETVGAGQNEVDIVRTADTVAVLVPPGSGDDVQMLKAGILEIGDVFVVNKADLEGADRTVQQLREMLQGRSTAGHHGASGTEMAEASVTADEDGDATAESEWEPPIVETVANRGEGVAAFIDALADHSAHLDRTGGRTEQARERFAAEIRTLLREDTNDLLAAELARQGGLEGHVDAVLERETDPYTVVDDVLAPLRDCLEE